MTPTQPLGTAGAFALLSAATLTIMVGSAIAPGLPSIAAQMGLGSNASWLITLPALGVIVFGAAAGRLIQNWGARRALIAGLMLYGVLGVLGAFLPGLWLVLADRFLLGGATALVMAGGTTLISEFYEGDARLTMLARQGMSIELGGVIFLAVGGVLAGFGWQAPFALYLLAWVFLALILTQIPRHAPIGAEAAAPTGPETGGLRDVYAAAGMSMLLFFIAIVTLPRQLADQGFSEAASGYYLSFISMVAVVAAGVMPRVIKRLRARRTLLLAFVLYGAGHAIYALQPALPGLIAAAICMGTGFAFSIPLANHEIVERSSRAERGRNLSRLSVAIFGGQFLSSFVELATTDTASTFLGGIILAVLILLILLATARLRTPAAAR
ncbi:MFS transporter [Falsirhodobacter algicola]|uniref:MFS transporter n=1 Tax=Falsirhodobacter algicola TaxID=2692330 RepID=A0A8J8MV49_9RHOB|nr:MFS transporter [Falsirhodobacter algicola]QUS36996.1 MFS transporter [Falsirhodobacter algicola]